MESALTTGFVVINSIYYGADFPKHQTVHLSQHVSTLVNLIGFHNERINMRSILATGILALSVLLSSCASSQKDFDAAQKVQDASEQSIRNTDDYDIKIKSCDDAINALGTFIREHPEGEYSQAATTARDSWQSRKEGFQAEIKKLSEKLQSAMAKKAADEAMKKHSFCNIEKITVENSDTQKDGPDLLANASFNVRMKGALLGMNIFKLSVRVSGRVHMASKTISVDEHAVVEE